MGDRMTGIVLSKTVVDMSTLFLLLLNLHNTFSILS